MVISSARFCESFDKCNVMSMNQSFSELLLQITFRRFRLCKNHDSRSGFIETMNNEAPSILLLRATILNASIVERVLLKLVCCNRKQTCWLIDNEDAVIFKQHVEVVSLGTHLACFLLSHLCLRMNLNDLSLQHRMFCSMNDGVINRYSLICEHFSKDICA